MVYSDIESRLRDGGMIILDGGTGTELERRGVSMDPEAWCGRAALDNADILEDVHRDYITAGADVITANTYASSPLMLAPAGLDDRFGEINRRAIGAAHEARRSMDRDDVLIAGSLSHMCPMRRDSAEHDPGRIPGAAEMADAFARLADLHRSEGCDLILLEMMYDPLRAAPAFAAATATGLPVWAGFSARRGDDGAVLSFAPDRDLSFRELIEPLLTDTVAAAGVMHTPSDLIGEAIATVRDIYDGPLLAYPDSGYFKMPHWRFEDIIAPEDFARFAAKWRDSGVQIIGGCCGLSPDHIAALRQLRDGIVKPEGR